LGFPNQLKRRIPMKRILSVLLTLAAAAALVPAVHAQCTNATLTGNYAFSQTGFISNAQKGNPLPAANVGVSTFDGAGNVSATYTDMSPGKPGGYGTPIQGTGSGTYTVNSDCTGSASFTSGDAAGITLNMVIISGGTEVFSINTTPLVILTADFKKQ
jgi:hypothetical protein